MGETDLFTVAVSLSLYNHYNLLTPVYHRSTLVVTVFFDNKIKNIFYEIRLLARISLLYIRRANQKKKKKKRTNNKNILTLLEIAFKMDQPDGSTMQQADIDALIFEARQVCTKSNVS